MELATNTFSKGLLMDTNPMVLGTDTLTDCLNGTLITMNGNEVILLNDMGNRRVNNAFLPSGYLPVGMKEYGGIIYVAAYNPITNKSLIGSFPSPQRKIGEVFEGENALSATFDFKNFFKYKDENNSTDYNIEKDDYLHIDVLKSDSFLVPLTGNYNLRAGDKFTIYSPDLYGSGENYEKFLYLYITNYKNTANGKIKSPKNKKYTLSVGVLNSLNEFVDITKTLSRWNNNNIVPYDSSYTDLYKFNDYYFIANNFNNDAFSESINDSQLIKTRLRIATNTYAYKLVGPLYLKITLNHILDFNYNLEILKIEDSQSNSEEKIATLRIDGYITYNCPDGVSEISSDFVDDTYITFEEGKPNLNAFDFLDENTLTILSPINTIINNSVYNKISNTYSVLITKFYNVKYTESNSTLNYIIGVNADKDFSNLYLKNLSHKGFINFELFGSGKIILSKWQFKNEDAFTNLTLLLETYPKLGEIFDNLKLIFTDISTINTNEVKTITVDSIKISNSPITLPLDWQFYKFEPLKIYLVDIKYDRYKDGKIVESDITLDDIKGSIICKSILFKTEESSLSDTESDTESEEILVTNNDFRWKADYIDGDTIKSIKVDGDEIHMGKLLIEELASYILPLAENFLYNNPNYILKNLVIGSKTKLMGNISGSMELESVEILPGGLTSLPGFAFSECTKLKSVILPEGLTTITGSCFHYCTSLETLFLPKSIENFSVLNVLEGCTSLKTLFLGPNINRIGYWFVNGPIPETLTDIYCYNINPPEIPNDEPRGVGRLCISRKDITTWHFPIEALEAYENWVEEGDARGLLYKEFVFDITEEEILMYGKNILELETYDNEELEEEIILELPEEKIKLKKTNVNTRWFITTELFNEFYDSNIIQDFCITDNLDFLNKMNVPLNLSVSNVNKTIEHKDSFYEGNLLSDIPSSAISFKQKNSCIINCNEKLKISSLDLSLYPIIFPDILLKYKGNYNVYLNNTLLDENNTPNEVFKRYSHFAGNYNPGNPSLFDFNIDFNQDKTEFIGNINWYDICFGESSSLPTTISNCFDSLSTIFNHFGPGNYVRIYYNNDSELENKKTYRIENSSEELITTGTFSDIEGLSSIFNDNLGGLVFSYGSSSFPDESENLIWWKVGGSSSLWTCISNNIHLYGSGVSSNIKDIILNYFGGDLIYCIYKDKDFYVIDGNYIYSDTYNINMNISVPIVLKTNTYIDFWNIGNLNFNSENLYISPLSINVPITLNENFKDLILLTVMNKSYENIEVNSGILLDINKKTLQPNTVYYKNNNNLVPVYLNKYFIIDDESEINSIKLNTFGLYDYYYIFLAGSRSKYISIKFPRIGTHLVTNSTLHPRGSEQTSNPRGNT